MTIVSLAATEQLVRSVESVQDTQRAVVLVEPVGRTGGGGGERQRGKGELLYRDSLLC